MNFLHNLKRSLRAIGLGFLCAWSLLLMAAEPGPALPSVVQSGLTLLASGGPQPAVDTWFQGGILERYEGANRNTEQRLKAFADRLGNYRAYELIETRAIGRTSQLLYLTLNFDRGAVYARFLVCRADKQWVVQSLAFDLKPEALMPWLETAQSK